MSLPLTVIALVLFIDRLTEMVKSALKTSPSFANTSDDVWNLLILLISMVLGVLGMLLVFPAANLFTGLGASTTAELIASGVVVAGLANGVDFLSGNLSNILPSDPPVTPAPMVVAPPAVVVTPEAPPAA